MLMLQKIEREKFFPMALKKNTSKNGKVQIGQNKFTSLYSKEIWTKWKCV